MPNGGSALTKFPGRSWPGSGWRFAHAFEQVLQDRGIVLRFIFRSKQERQSFSLMRKLIEFLQVWLSLRL